LGGIQGHQEAWIAERPGLRALTGPRLFGWAIGASHPAGVAARGRALVAAATLVAELGDITRFANPRAAHGVSWFGAIRAFQRPHTTPRWHRNTLPAGSHPVLAARQGKLQRPITCPAATNPRIRA